MSLINQMLYDLERRRAEEFRLAKAPLRSVKRYTVAANPFPWFTFGLIFLLIVAIGTLLWDRYRNPATSQVAQHAMDVNTIVRQQKTIPAAADVLPPFPAAGTDAVRNEPATPIKKEVVARSEQTPKDNIKKKNAIKTKEQQHTPQVAIASMVQKRTHPLTPGQQAEKSYRKAYTLLAQGKSVAGEIALREALQREPRHLRARELLAGTYIKAGRYVEAAQLLRQGVKLQPRYPMFARLYARVLLQQKQIDSAISVLSKAPPSIAEDPHYHALLAALYQQQGNHQAAAGTYARLLKKYPQQGIWWIGLGISQEKLGEHKKAVTAYRQARRSGSLPHHLQTYTDNRLQAMQESGYPGE